MLVEDWSDERWDDTFLRDEVSYQLQWWSGYFDDFGMIPEAFSAFVAAFRPYAGQC